MESMCEVFSPFTYKLCFLYTTTIQHSHAFILWSYRVLNRAHATSKFVHLVCNINMVGLTPITKWKNVLKKEQYDECIKKVGKTWYNLTNHAMIEILFKVELCISIFILWRQFIHCTHSYIVMNFHLLFTYPKFIVSTC